MSEMRASILPLRADRLALTRDGQRLIDTVSFTLPQGGITTIIGPNGAGKSLTLRLCHGLIAPDEGRVTWARDARLRHAMVFQQPVMLRRSVRANIAHALHAVTHPGVRSRTDEALARFHLTSLAQRPARLLSGGEKQKLAIARAWATEPEVLFLDEPTSQLDPAATREIEALIHTLSLEGLTLVMTTHDLGQARRLADRILFFNRGRLVEDADATSFFERPATPQARAFIAGELLE